MTGPDERPLAGAAVRIWPEGDESGASTTATDEEGRWRIVGLEPGRWRIRIVVEGFFPGEGWFQALAARPETTVDVELRSLAERSPSFAENSGTVLGWIEKGNALLEQGAAAAARAEYEKALPALPRAERPQVLQAVARTHFVEGDLDRAIERLQEALAIAGEDADLERLFLTLLKTAGRLDEAERLLAEARSETPLESEPPTPRAFRPPEPGPLVEAVAGRTGRFRTAFAERSPLSEVAAYRARFGVSEDELRAADPSGGRYDLEAESFELYVPESYDAERPHGLLVWVSPTPYGGFRNPEFQRVLSERQLIWVGANDSGNGRWDWYRVGLALDAVHNARRLYAVDPERIYVAGYSGGGRVASALALLYPEVFDGGFFLYGADYFEPLPVPDRPGAMWPARFPPPPKPELERVKTGSRFVLLTGDLDFNRAQTKRIHRAMRDDGFEHLTYLQIPAADHYHGLPPAWLERGLDGLDG